MKFDVMLSSVPGTVVAETLDARDRGAEGVWVVDTKHDPFLLVGAAAAAPAELRLGTAVAVASARNPMLLAMAGYDLQLYSAGRFVLGLGTQVRPHVTRRFSMPWGKPVARMRETVQALHAVWDAWEGNGPLRHRGEFFTLDLMTPAFSPAPHPYGRPPVVLGGLGPVMTSLAGEVADGFVVHRFMTRRYLEEVTLPRLGEGQAARAGQRRPFEVIIPPFFAAPDDPRDLDRDIAEVRRQIAFYASTPSYAPVLALHGWESVGQELHDRSRRSEWDAMAALISDEMLEAFAVICHADQLRSELGRRYAGLVDRAILYPPVHAKEPS